jgi:methionyl-tRNA formyltransferase
VFAQSGGLRVLQPAKIRTDEARTRLEPLLASADACVVAAYGRILPKWMLDAPKNGCINVHFSLLPKYRGAAPINWAIANGEHETGITIMQMDEGLDTGPILLQHATSIKASETASELGTRLSKLGSQLIIEALKGIEAGTIVPVVQNDAEATQAPMLKREDARIDWSLSASAISNRLRGFTPFPGCHTLVAGGRLEILAAMPEAYSSLEIARSNEPGTVVAVSKDDFSVLCGGQTLLRVSRVQPEGRRSMAVRDYLNGSHITIGMLLE